MQKYGCNYIIVGHPENCPCRKDEKLSCDKCMSFKKEPLPYDINYPLFDGTEEPVYD